MTGGVPVIGGLQRLEDLMAGQEKWAVDIQGGTIENATLINCVIEGGGEPGDLILPSAGGTGIANSDANTITLGGDILTANNLTTAGNFALTLTATGTTNVTLPTTGTLATRAGSEALTNKSVNGVTLTTAGSSTNYLNASGTYTAVVAGTGTVTSVSVASANGFTGTVATATTTPAITIRTSVTGLLKGNGTAISAAVGGTDYYAPGGTDIPIADGGTGASTAANAFANLKQAATTSATGVIQIATTAVTQTGTSTTTAVTPAGLKESLGFSKFYESPPQTITAAGNLSLAHGLGTTPIMWKSYLICVNATQGYSVDQVVEVNAAVNSNGTPDRGQVVVPDSTNLDIRFGADSNTYVLLNKTTGQQFATVNSNWNYFIRAWG